MNKFKLDIMENALKKAGFIHKREKDKRREKIEWDKKKERYNDK